MTKARIRGIGGLTVVCVVGLSLGPTRLLLAQRKSADEWEVLNGCRLITNATATVDGDSFHVRHNDREYIFRLYFVDTPETDPALKERAKDQAAYFGISPGDIPRAGQAASRFTHEILSGTGFTVITRWRNAMGRSSLARYYAVVLVKGKNLAEELVTHGYARIFGLKANWPDGPRSTTFINQLKNLEINARVMRRGVWDQASYPQRTNSGAPITISTNAPATTAPLDLNSASYEELQTLPGIGPKLAERIMAYRPYKTVNKLTEVPGIGKETLRRLKPLVSVEAVPP